MTTALLSEPKPAVCPACCKTLISEGLATAGDKCATCADPLFAKLALRFGRSKSVIAVDSILEASDAWCKLRDEQGLGASESPKVTVIDTATGKTVATISYNGRAWEGTKEGGKEIALDGYKTVAEHNADGWKDCLA